MSTTWLILLVVFLVICSGFFSASETAFATASKPRLKNEAESGNPRAIRAESIVDHFVQAISTILVGNNLVNIATTSVITLLCTEYYFPDSSRADLIAEGIATIVLLIFGEIFPKILAADHSNQLVLAFSAPLKAVMLVFKPVVFVVSAMVEKLSVLWTPEDQEPSMTDEELAMVVDSIQEEGVFTESEGELIKSAIEFGEVTAHDILTPRVDILAYDIDSPLTDLLSDPDAMSFSRLPVYRESIDHIIGILPTKQLMKTVLTTDSLDSISIEDMLLEPIFVHMTKNINDILKEFRRKQAHVAIVLDEYGGTMGILTVEDILEEIVGEIYDETDEVEEEEVTEVAQDTFILDGSMNLQDAFAEIDYDPKDFSSEYSTLSGWVTEKLDHFPEEGDSFTFDRLTIKILSAADRLAEQVEVHVDRTAEES